MLWGSVATHTGFERILHKFEKGLACVIASGLLPFENGMYIVGGTHGSKRMDVRAKPN